MPNPPHWTTLSLPKELIAELDAIGRAEDRTRPATLRRLLATYREQQKVP
jgi:predicted transcriptional regulator